LTQFEYNWQPRDLELKDLNNFEGENMKNIRTLFATVMLALVITGSALAGETQTPPCAPGETQTPPCSNVVASTDPGETSTPPQSVDIVSLGELALDLLLY
jgi:hypothetical protein